MIFKKFKILNQAGFTLPNKTADKISSVQPTAVNFLSLRAKKSNLAGFTLIELFVVITIFIVLALATWPFYSNWQVIGRLDSTTGQIIDALRTAQAKSQTGYNDATHGVYFDTAAGQFISYQGDNYELRNPEFDVVGELDSDIELTIDDIASEEIIFSRYTGSSSAVGIIILTNRIGVERRIMVNDYSYIQEN